MLLEEDDEFVPKERVKLAPKGEGDRWCPRLTGDALSKTVSNRKGLSSTSSSSVRYRYYCISFCKWLVLVCTNLSRGTLWLLHAKVRKLSDSAAHPSEAYVTLSACHCITYYTILLLAFHGTFTVFFFKEIWDQELSKMDQFPDIALVNIWICNNFIYHTQIEEWLKITVSLFPNLEIVNIR